MPQEGRDAFGDSHDALFLKRDNAHLPFNLVLLSINLPLALRRVNLPHREICQWLQRGFVLTPTLRHRRRIRVVWSRIAHHSSISRRRSYSLAAKTRHRLSSAPVQDHSLSQSKDRDQAILRHACNDRPGHIQAGGCETRSRSVGCDMPPHRFMGLGVVWCVCVLGCGKPSGFVSGIGHYAPNAFSAAQWPGEVRPELLQAQGTRIVFSQPR